MPIHNCVRCPNTLYMYDMDVGCSLKGFTASKIVWWDHFHTPYHEDDDDPTLRNKGGRPKGSTDAKKRDKAMQVLDACNWVCNKYAAEQDKNNGTAPAGLRRELR